MILGRAYFQLFQIGLSQMASRRKLPLSQALNGEKKPLIQISGGRAFQEEENNRCKDPEANLVCSYSSEDGRMAGIG